MDLVSHPLTSPGKHDWVRRLFQFLYPKFGGFVRWSTNHVSQRETGKTMENHNKNHRGSTPGCPHSHKITTPSLPSNDRAHSAFLGSLKKSFSICLPWSDLHRWSIFNCPGCWTHDVYVICLLFFRLQLVYPFWSCQKYSQSHRSNPGSGLDAPSLSSMVGSHSIWFAFCALKLWNLSKHLPA